MKKFPHQAIFSIALITLCEVTFAQTLPQTSTPSNNQTQEQLQSPTQEFRRDVYGAQLMSTDEIALHRAKMRAAKTPAEREKLRAEHHASMQERAKQKGITLADPPPFNTDKDR